MIVKRRCINSVSTEAFEIFSQGEMSESGGNCWCDLWDDSCGVSDCDSGTGTSVLLLLVVTDVTVSPSSVVTEVCDGFSLGSDGELVEPQSFSFSQKACSLLDSYAGRDEVRKFISKNASAVWKKNDAAYTTTKLAFIV